MMRAAIVTKLWTVSLLTPTGPLQVIDTKLIP